MKAILNIAGNAWRETGRLGIFWLVMGFSLLLLATAWGLSGLALVDRVRVFEDVGLCVMAFSINVLAVVIAVDLLLAERERGTLALHAVFGVSPRSVLAGRFLGACLSIVYALALMGVVFLFVDFALALRWDLRMVAVVAMLAVEAVVLASLAVLFASFLGRWPAILLAAAVFLVGHFGQEVLKLSASGENFALAAAGNIAFFVIPHLEFFNLYGAWLARALPSPLETAAIAVYGIVYSGGVVAAAALVYGRRAR